MLVRGDPHGFEITAILTLPSALLNLLVGNLEARQIMPHNEPDTVFGSQVALVASGKVAGSATVGVVLRNDRLQVAAGHVARRAGADGTCLPGVLHSGESAGSIEAATE